MRVVAGTLRGRSLKAPPGDATRPTGAKVKEAVFSILGDVSDARVLDLYAGSGALGIEALSRGAAHAVFVEAARPALTCLRDNIDKLGLAERATLLGLRVESARSKLAQLGPFELVLCDPPWRDIVAARRALELLVEAGLLLPSGRIVLEHSAKDTAGAASTPAGSPTRLETMDMRTWGDTAVSFLSPADAPVRENP